MAKQTKITPNFIVDTALKMAAETGWDALAMTDLAAHLKISPTQLQSHFFDKNAIADTWFARALDAMLQPLRDESL